MTKKQLLLVCGLLALNACEPTPRPDYAIQVTPTASGGVAVPPPCPSWNTETTNPFDNQPMPQFGCADARNLAMMVERPDDLIQGRPTGTARGVTAVGAIRRYDNNQPRGLIMPGAEVNSPATTTAPTSASTMTGDITGATATGGSGGTSSSSSSAAGP